MFNLAKMNKLTSVYVVEGSKLSSATSIGRSSAADAVEMVREMVRDGYQNVRVRDPVGRYLTIADLQNRASSCST